MKIFLIIRADRTCRVVTKRPRPRADEVAIPLWVKFPEGWGTVLLDKQLNIDVPGFPEVEIEVA